MLKTLINRVSYYLINLGILIILFWIPLIPSLEPFGFEQTKVIAFFWVMVFIIPCWFIYLFLNHKNLIIKFSKIKLIAFIFLGCLAISTILSTNFSISLIGRNPYFQGFILYCDLFFLFLITNSVKISEKNIYYSLIGSSFIISLISIKELILNQSLILDYKIISTFGHPAFYSGFILLTIPLYIWAIKFNKKIKKILILMLIISTIGILISQSKISILILLISGYPYLINKLNMSKKYLYIFTLIIIFGSISLSIIFHTGLVWTEIILPNNPNWLLINSPDKRIFIWEQVFHLILSKPILGYGLETLLDNFSKVDITSLSSVAALNVKDLVIDRSHNYLLDLIYSSGFITAFNWITLYFIILKKAKDKEIKYVLIIYFIWIQFQVQPLIFLIIFWLIAGLLDRNDAVDNNTENML